MRRVSGLLTIAAASAAFAIATPANAAIELVGTYSGNDCGGPGGFSACYAYPGGTQQGPVDNGSPAVFKYNKGGGIDISSNYASITGSEFDIDFSAGANSLAFTYTPGAGDPDIHYVAVKQANGFALFYDANPITSGLFNLSDYFPNNPGYSHITFFNSGSGSGAVPEPATWALMLLGFGALGWALRRRDAAASQPRMRVSYN